MDYKAILAETEERREHNYIDEPGTHYLKFVGYDFFDGSIDKETGRGHSGAVGPLFLFEVVDSPVWPKGRACSKMINIMRSGANPAKTATVRKIAVNEVRQLVRALDGGEAELSAQEIAEILPNVDAVSAEFDGKVIRCDGKQSGDYVNLTYYPDDRRAG